MKKSLFTGFIALAALTMTSCSNDENMVSIPQGNAIEFGTYVGRDAQTKGSVLDNTVATGLPKQGFGVFAYYTDEVHYNGTAGTGSKLNFMNNTHVTSNDGTTWTYSPLKYWPNETNDRLTFFAYAPYDDADYTANTSSGYDNIKFEVNYGDPIVEFTVNGTVKDQQDLVWSRTNNKDIIKNPDVGVTEEVAHATIERTDKYRADYYEYYTHGNYWTNPVNYDMTLNSQRVGVDNCVKTIEQYLIIKGLITPDMIKSE